MPCGHWSGAHAVGWDLNAPPFGEREIGDLFQKHSYPYGIMVNANGERFVDEGADFRNFTYAKYGVEVLKQPDATRDVSVDAVLSMFALAGVALVFAAIGGLIVGAIFIGIRRMRDASAPPTQEPSHVRLKI